MTSTRDRRGVWETLNPAATRDDTRRVRGVLDRLVPKLAQPGDRSVLLAGSWARGDARRNSDIDLWVLGRRSRDQVLWRDPFMVTVKWTTKDRERRKLREPPFVGGSVPGWRAAVLLHDPRGVAARLQEEARSFRWERIADRCDRWAAEQMVGWAEEAVKLVRALATGNAATAAVQRNLLAERLGFVMAIHRRIFWDSENEFWERIGRQVGGAWQNAQRRALGVPQATLDQSCRAALSLYALTARAVWGLLRPDQRSIVAHTCQVGGAPLPKLSSLD